AYITGEIAFNPLTGNAGAMPAFWAMDVEHMVGRVVQWRGQAAGYEHFIELDIFEFDRDQKSLPSAYGGTLHDTYGTYGSTCGKGYCIVSSDWRIGTLQAPHQTDFNEFHRIAALWVPATASKKGYVKFYFDDIPLGRGFSWTQYTDQAPPLTPSTPWAFGVIDKSHLVLNLGSGSSSMRIRSIDVWQGPDACNIFH
ncbi:MAG: hypothetical protein WB608_24905, partial [Terracidiphilus sp.]